MFIELPLPPHHGFIAQGTPCIRCTDGRDRVHGDELHLLDGDGSRDGDPHRSQQLRYASAHSAFPRVPPTLAPPPLPTAGMGKPTLFPGEPEEGEAWLFDLQTTQTEDMDGWPNKMPWAPFNRADPANLPDDDDEDGLPDRAPHHWDRPFYYKLTETVGSITGSYYQSPMIFSATVAAPPNGKLSPSLSEPLFPVTLFSKAHTPPVCSKVQVRHPRPPRSPSSPRPVDRHGLPVRVSSASRTGAGLPVQAWPDGGHRSDEPL